MSMMTSSQILFWWCWEKSDTKIGEFSTLSGPLGGETIAAVRVTDSASQVERLSAQNSMLNKQLAEAYAERDRRAREAAARIQPHANEPHAKRDERK